jgi:hypothetical protein
MTSPTILVRRSDQALVIRRVTKSIVIRRSGVPGASAGGLTIDVVTGVVNGQVDFVLSARPADPAKVRMHINGQQLRPPSFTVTGQVVRWQSEFLINDTDEIEFTYTV